MNDLYHMTIPELKELRDDTREQLNRICKDLMQVRCEPTTPISMSLEREYTVEYNDLQGLLATIDNQLNVKYHEKKNVNQVARIHSYDR